MIFDPPLEKARLIKRYKRFLADVVHSQLGEITVHCPNTGSMKHCWQPDWTVWLQKSDNRKRKYPFTWNLVEDQNQDLLCINTHIANGLVEEAIKMNRVSEIGCDVELKREVKYGKENSRIDLLAVDQTAQKNYIEVKSVTLKELDGCGYFPDSPTVRGQKHLRELMQCVSEGHRATLFFMVMHSGINEMKIAKHIDPHYAALVAQAEQRGVEILAYKASIDSKNIVLDHRINCILE